MKRAATWTFLVPALVVACTSTEPGGLGGPSPDASVPETQGPDSGAPPTCGDGTIDADEKCDDGNAVSGDGCSAECTVESRVPGDVCPGIPIAFTPGVTTFAATISGTTAPAADQYSGSCGGRGGHELVYVATPDVTGVLTAKLTSAERSLLYIRRTCDDTKSEISCDTFLGGRAPAPVSVSVTKGEPVYLIVDRQSATGADFTLDVVVSAAACGDGFAQAPEVCDDGNTAAGDGCAANCAFDEGGITRDCPGQPITLTGAAGAPRKISIAGDTAGLSAGKAPGLLSSGCGSSGSNEVYAVATDIAGSLRAKLTATYPRATLYIRTECKDAVTQLDCTGPAEALQQTTELTVPVVPGRRHYIVVDSGGGAGTEGPYALDIEITPTQCGNGILDGNEECDDGNTIAGDGCKDDCTLEPVDLRSDDCPGLRLDLALAPDGSYARSLTSSTEPLGSHHKAKTAGCNATATAKDAVYEVVPPQNGRLYLSAEGAFDLMLSVRDACSTNPSAYNELVCEDDINGNAAESASIPGLANVPVYVVVDGETQQAAGPFKLEVRLVPAVCGNGILDGGETCDDSNVASGDGCSATCQVEPPMTHDTCSNADAIALTANGDGTYSASVSAGTTGLGSDQTFSTTCASAGRDAIYTLLAPIDGVLNVEVPTSSFNVSLGARTVCTSGISAPPLTCSNRTSGSGDEAIVLAVTAGQTYYLIVDGVAAADFGAFTMNVKVRPPGCGDGIVAGSETCDDANVADGDGCSTTCASENLAGIDTCPGYSLPLVGAGNAPRKASLTVDTSALAANYAGTCGGSSREGVVVVTPDIGGTLTARVTGQTYKPVLYARTSCGDAATEKICSIDAQAPGVSTREITIANVAAGTSYYLFVDGFQQSAGIGRLDVTVTP